MGHTVGRVDATYIHFSHSNLTVPPTSTPPPHLPTDQPVNLADYALLARGRLSTSAWAYFSGGAANEHTVRANQDAWAAVQLLPRVLKPMQGAHTRISLLQRTLEHPVLLAPMAYQCLAHPDGEIAMACAASAMGAGMVLSTLSTQPVEAVAMAMGITTPGQMPTPTPTSAPSAAPLWFQLYWQADREAVLGLVQRAQAAGCQALMVTVDAPCHGARDRERRAGFALPPGMRAVHLPQDHHEADAQHALPPPHSTLLSRALVQQAPTWDDLAWLIQQTSLPVVLKGILHPDDACHAADIGAAGVVVSNHGGRTLDTSVATAAMLARVATALQGRIALLVDGGIRRGTDVLKAIALGADAVLLGRPALYGLAHNGAHGVAHVLRLLIDELEIAMALCGCRTLADASADLVISPYGASYGAQPSSHPKMPPPAHVWQQALHSTTQGNTL